MKEKFEPKPPQENSEPPKIEEIEKDIEQIKRDVKKLEEIEKRIPNKGGKKIGENEPEIEDEE